MDKIQKLKEMRAYSGKDCKGHEMYLYGYDYDFDYGHYEDYWKTADFSIDLTTNIITAQIWHCYRMNELVKEISYPPNSVEWNEILDRALAKEKVIFEKTAKDKYEKAKQDALQQFIEREYNSLKC
jgi:hypothetical protein